MPDKTVNPSPANQAQTHWFDCYDRDRASKLRQAITQSNSALWSVHYMLAGDADRSRLTAYNQT